MLTWHEENGKYLGFDDDTYMYRVTQDENGWYYEHIQDCDGMDGYDTAAEAMAAAEAEYEFEEGLKPEYELDELLDVLTDDCEDAYWDMVAHERMEAEKLGL